MKLPSPGEAILHHGCMHFGMNSACYDASWLNAVFSPQDWKLHSRPKSVVGFIYLRLDTQALYHRRMDLLTSMGILTLFQFVVALLCPHPVQIHHLEMKSTISLSYKARRLRPGSLCWIGVPCSTWIFMCLVLLKTL